MMVIVILILFIIIILTEDEGVSRNFYQKPILTNPILSKFIIIVIMAMITW